MAYYDVPAPFKPGLEKQIIDVVHEQIGGRFKSQFDSRRIGGSLPLSPQQALATIHTKKELAVELMATEPLVVSPAAIDWAPHGRVSVTEMVHYPTDRHGAYK